MTGRRSSFWLIKSYRASFCCRMIFHLLRFLVSFSICVVRLRVKARLTMLAKHSTLFGGVGRCLTSVGCVSVQGIQHHLTVLEFGTRSHDLITRAKMLDNVGWKVWTKSNFIQCCSTPSNTIQHRPTLFNMFDCAVQMGQTYCTQQRLIMFDQHVLCVWPKLLKWTG